MRDGWPEAGRQIVEMRGSVDTTAYAMRPMNR